MYEQLIVLFPLVQMATLQMKAQRLQRPPRDWERLKLPQLNVPFGTQRRRLKQLIGPDRYACMWHSPHYHRI